MATLSYDPERGQWRVWYHDGLRRRSEVVARMPRRSPKPKYPPPEATARLAELERVEADSRSSRPRDPSRTLADFLAADLRRFADSERRSASVAMLGRVGRNLLRFAALRKIDLLGAFDADAARGYLEWRAARGIGGNSLATERGYLGGVWGRAVERGEVLANVWAGVRLPKKPAEPRRPAWTVEQFEKVHEQARPWLRRLLVFGTRTGLRLGELIRAERGWVERRAGAPAAVVVPATVAKSGKSRRIPLHADARRIVETADDEHATILRTQQNTPIPSNSSVDKAIRTACRRAKLAEVGSHAIRRSFGRWAVLGQGPWKGKPVPMYVVSRWLGHSSLAMTARYLDLEETASDQWMSGGADAGEDEARED